MPGTRNITRKKEISAKDMNNDTVESNDESSSTDISKDDDDDNDNDNDNDQEFSDSEVELPDLLHKNPTENGSVGNGQNSDSESEKDSEITSNESAHDAEIPQPINSNKLEFNTKTEAIAYPVSRKGTKNPPYKIMVTEAIQTLDEKKGSSLMAIKKWIIANYPYTLTPNVVVHIKKAITSGIEAGIFYHPKDGSHLGSRLKLTKKPPIVPQKPKKDSKQGKFNNENKLFDDAAKRLKSKQTTDKKVKKLPIKEKVPKKVATDAATKDKKVNQPKPEKKKIGKPKQTTAVKKNDDEKVPKKTKNPKKKTNDKENVAESNEVEVPSKIPQKPKVTKKNVQK